MRNNPRRMVWTRFWSIYVLCGLVWAALGIPAPVSADSAGSAIYFDGVNDFIDINETLQIIGPTWKNTKSVSLWIKPEGTGQPCLEGGDVAFCDVILGDLPRFWGVVRGVRSPGQGQPAVDRIWIWNFDSWTTGSDVIGVAYTPGEWIHIAVVHTGGSLTVYVNGVTYPAWTIASGDTISPDNPSQQPHLHLGGVINSPTRISTFEGQIDEVRIYSTAISASDIQANYQSELVGNEPGLEAYYKMSDGTGLSLTDDSGQGWTGTLYDGNASAPADGHVPEWVASTAFDSLPPTPTPPTPTATSTATNTVTVTPSQTVTSTVTTTPIPTDTPTPGSAGYALGFDGANDYVEVANTGDMIGPNWAVTKSFSMWIKPEGSAPVCQNDVVAFCDLILSDTFRYWGISRGVRAPSPGQNAIDRIWIYNQDSTDGSYNQRAIGIAYTPGQWLHIAVAHANGLLIVYVNGQTRAELQTASAATQGFPGTLTIGGAINGSRVTTFQGLIDEVRIYSSAITQTEVVNSIQNELTGGEPGLAAYYKMSDGTGLSLTDNGVNGWTGTLKDGTGSSSPDGHSPQWIGSDAFDAPLDPHNPGGDWTIYLPLTMNP